MLRIFLFLTVIIAAVYSDYCTEKKCNSETDAYGVNYYLKKYGIHCCIDGMKDSIGLFANDSSYIVR